MHRVIAALSILQIPQASIALYDVILKNGNANGGGNANPADAGKGGAYLWQAH